jgi:pimeloyl-ACP methyl ester carboxylesterase
MLIDEKIGFLLSSEARVGSIPCASVSGPHSMRYHEWGDPNNSKVVICVHGVARCAYDFQVLAKVLSKDYRVICPDIVGRGFSDWLADGKAYQISQYVTDMSNLMVHLGLRKVDWVGTSMGGLIGLLMANLPAQPIRRLILNDVGPAINSEALIRIGSYIGKTPKFLTQEEGVAYYKQILESFGKHSEEEWRALCLPTLRPIPIELGGGWRVHYDPKIADNFVQTTPTLLHASEMALWNVWDHLSMPILVIRGEQSDLLSKESVLQMCQRNSGASYVEIPDVGHAPTLIHKDQIKLVQSFLGILKLED